jgi:hypothetical protein
MNAYSTPLLRLSGVMSQYYGMIMNGGRNGAHYMCLTRQSVISRDSLCWTTAYGRTESMKTGDVRKQNPTQKRRNREMFNIQRSGHPMYSYVWTSDSTLTVEGNRRVPQKAYTMSAKHSGPQLGRTITSNPFSCHTKRTDRSFNVPLGNKAAYGFDIWRLNEQPFDHCFAY